MKKEERERRIWRALSEALLDIKRTEAKRRWKIASATLKTWCSRNF